MAGFRVFGCLVLAAAVGASGCGSAFSAGPGLQADGGADGAPDASSDGGPEASPDASPDASTDASNPPSEGGAQDAAEGDAGSGSIDYVSPTGSDSAAGTEPSHPKKTVTAGLAAAQQLGGSVAVHVCNGTYAEASLTVDFDVALRGAYNCASWTRTPTYGYPNPHGINATILTTPQDLIGPTAALTLSGSAVSSATVVDGFVIVGAGTSSFHTIGVDIQSASPVLSNDVIVGGDGHIASSTDTGSIGVVVDEGAREITSCISGGGGSGAVGSIGVVLETSGAVNLHDAIVTGGTGTSRTERGRERRDGRRRRVG